MKFDLVFEGGGAKGMIFVGAMQAFEARNLEYNRLMGTSAGSITAVFLAAGYTIPEIQLALNETAPDGRPIFATFLGEPAAYSQDDIEKSNLLGFLESVDTPILPDWVEERLDRRFVKILATDPRLRNVFNFIEHGGWYTADSFLTWIRKYMDMGELNGKPRHFSRMTMAQFYQATGRDLTLIAADTSGANMLVLNHRTAPDLPVVFAARMSMSVPLLWEEVIWQPEWGAYRGKNLNGHAIVDGGLLSNFPIELFLSDAPQVTVVMGDKDDQEVIGFLIDESLQVPNAPVIAGVDEGRINLGALETVRRLHQLVNTVTQAHDKAVIEVFEELVVRLPAKGYGTTEFAMIPERRDALIAAGEQITGAYLDRRIAIASGIAAAPTPGASVAETKAIADRHALHLLGE
ncbi:MAG: patatin-like phospholipase family protein [Caldilineales bacterium]|nr:patatin-like phospholipase family protein [Caldilineales bacterium]